MIFITCTLLSISVLAAILSPFFLCEASIETKNLFGSIEKDLPEEETLLDQYLFLEKSFKNGKKFLETTTRIVQCNEKT